MTSVANDEPLLRVRQLSKHFPVRSQGLLRRQIGVVKACDEVTFDLYAGQTLGLVGESGCGKTTTGRTILRALMPTSGRVLFRTSKGQTVDLAQLSESELIPLRTQLQMIFQDPFASLNPRMTVGAIVREPLDIHRIGTPRERNERVAAMLERVGLKPEHRTRYPHAFSGGQRQRVGIARALIVEPSLVVCDEAVSALDVSVQAQVINLLQSLQREMGLTYLFIAHDLSVVRHICDHVAVMYAGRLVEYAPTHTLFNEPKHPYTQALLASVPDPDPDQPMQPGLTGEVADTGNLPGGCAFHPRCSECMDVCRTQRPVTVTVGGHVDVACHLYPAADHPETERFTAKEPV